MISWSGRQDSNLRPSAPKADALPNCATSRYYGAPDMSRTRNLQIRSLTLYPIELRAHSGALGTQITHLEVPIGIEPMVIELQSIALPLG
jgi:hypothetical protein